MKEKIVVRVFTWVVIIVSIVVGGAFMQCLLFKTATNTYADALKTWPALWFVYFLVAHSAGEQLYRKLTK